PGDEGWHNLCLRRQAALRPTWDAGTCRALHQVHLAGTSDMHTASSGEQTVLFAGGGEMGALMRSMDWSQTPLGPAERWSQSLRTTVNILLAHRFPLLLWWGPELCQLYNDPY